ncbi:hypothetical protein BT96DRAFT_994552 [Gymnopus androsaceus JB14]|uniref:Uncharacterized protein n=1 Tax=Gymnopus androsaceus JB14 TaxID=1447944 RepID=A0A6A4HML8_9AGAR|nr:hypothetical protein BT96DRAFT_994552 [Gymnopus androsaceus JB14]
MSHYLFQTRIEEPIYLEPRDMSFLRTRVSEAETQAENFECQIRAYEAQISELMRHRDARLVEIASCRNILSPIRRMPLEILSKIFQLSCLPDDGTWSHRYNLSSKVYAICGVCVAWRKAFHGTPRLWTKLCLNRKKHHKAFWGEVEYIHEWISRSGSLPLDFYLDISLERGPIGVASQSPSSYLPILSLAPSSLPLLEDVSFNVVDLGYDDFPGKIDVFSKAPKLKHVEIDFFEPSILERLRLPMEQLTSLKINDCEDLELFSDNPVVYVDILGQCKNLVYLHIELPWDDAFIRSCNNISIFFPALKSLNIPCYETGDGLYILSCLTTPLLEDLTLQYCGQKSSDIVAEVTDFQRRSAFVLSSLTLDSFNGKEFTEHLITMLSLFPSVHSFRMEEIFGVNHLLRALTCVEGDLNSILLPKLTHLALNQQRIAIGDYQLELTRMVFSRWWLGEASDLGVDAYDVASHSNKLVRLKNLTLRGFHYNIALISELPGLEVYYEAPRANRE